MSGNEDWLVKSNVEAGEGFADIIVETDDPDEGIIAELKYTKDFKAMEKSCEKALKQIKDRRYQEYLLMMIDRISCIMELHFAGRDAKCL